MGEQEMFLRTIQDLEASEHVPRAARLTVRSTYELIREAATKDPEGTAIALLSGGNQLEQQVRISYHALLVNIHQTANLLADLGVGAQDVIALLLPDLLETHLLFWGGQAAGIVCPISPSLPDEQIIALLQVVKAKMLVAPGPQVSQDLWQKAEAVRREVKSITCILQVRGPGEEQIAVYAFDALLEDYPSDCLHTGRDIAPDDIAVYLPTSNLAGIPSLLPLAHGNLLDAAWALGLVTTLAEGVLLRGLSRFFQGCWWSAAGS
jgi:fatty-acyl-CoA synthase